MKAMILAAGFGTRLWPLTIERTKPAIPFLNRPLIAYTIDYLKRYGITEIIINLHHEPDSVRTQIGDGSEYGVRITYALEEPEILGTAGALDNVREHLAHDTFLVINGKIITDLDLGAALATHRERKAIATLVLKENAKREKFSQIVLDAEGNYSGFDNFPIPQSSDINSQQLTSPLMFVGIHILEPAIFEYIPRSVFSDSIRDVYPAAMAAGKKIAAHVGSGDWFELSTLGRYVEIHREFLQREGKPFIADTGCKIAPDANVQGSVLWKNVHVGSGAKLIDCIIGDGVTIPPNAEFNKAAIVRADIAAASERPEKAAPAQIIGENLIASFG